MKTMFIDNRLVRYALLFSSIILLAIGGSLSSVYAISLTDYTFPVSTSQRGRVDSTFNLSDNSATSTQPGYLLNGAVSYDRAYRSLPLSYNLNFKGDFDLKKSTVKDADSEKSYDTFLNTRINKYINDESPVFGFGAVFLEYKKELTRDDPYDPYADVTVGVGYGRSVDATVLKQAMRINEDLKKYNVIKQDIPDNAMLELARVIDREDEYRNKYSEEEYKKYWYEDMEKIIRESGILSHDSLGALGIVRIQEILLEPKGIRLYGWEARAGVGYVISNFENRFGEGDPRLSLEFDWARPLSLKLQLNNNIFARTTFNSDQTYNLGEEFEVYYELSNKIDWDNIFTINYDILTAENTENKLALGFTSAYIFYLANQFNFTPSFNYSYLDDGVNDVLWDWRLTGSIGYRFL